MEAVTIVDALGAQAVYPDMTAREEVASVEYINKSIGIDVPPAKMANMLKRMGLTARLINNDKDLAVAVSPVRSDILFPFC